LRRQPISEEEGTLCRQLVLKQLMTQHLPNKARISKTEADWLTLSRVYVDATMHIWEDFEIYVTQ